MSLYPISPSPRGSCMRHSAVKSGSPLLARMNRFSAINSPFSSPRFNDFNCTPLKIEPTPKDTPSSLMSKLFSEPQLKDIMVMNCLLEERKSETKEPPSSKLTSSRKRVKPEADVPVVGSRRQKVGRFTETQIVSEQSEGPSTPSQNAKSLESPSYSYSESSYEEDDSDLDSDYGSPRRGGKFGCKYCKSSFKSAQALGGHMSRKHPGKSHDYNRKKEVRKRRELDRARLLLAKKMFYKEQGHDYERLKRLKDGKSKLKTLMNRARLKRIKTEITKKQLEDFVKSEGKLL
eukprot:TRINITY_DN8908_c0_g1_i3.p1 TRINITY_DN8908_c0_g1~~TRINITY_DN8908_c0_g1_i3.p1  ORF type:complete len:290 (-),score=70.52 TRINITY_DN8908_c0_g1_i3:221-1090(-)